MLNSTYAAISDCVIVFDIDKQKYLFISTAIADVLGITAQQLIHDGNAWLNLIDEKQRGDINKLIENLPVNESIELTYQVITPLQVTKNICDKKSRMVDDVTGHQILVSVIKEENHPNEITVARVREQFLNSLIDSQTNFLIRIDTKGRFSFVNRQFLKTFGYKANELIGQ